MAGMSLVVEMPRRPAVVKLKGKEDINVFVLAILQDEDIPVCVCEYFDGRIKNHYTECVKFVDTEGGMFK